MAEFLLWGAIAGLAYIYAGYPLGVCLLARWRPMRVEESTSNEPLSIVIVAHNEAARLPAKLDSIFRSERAHLIHEVIVASDGSSDSTPDVIEAIDDPRVRLVHFNERRGKPAVLNDVVPNCVGNIVVLTDARQELHPAALGELAAHFQDASVGVVSGELVFREAGDGSTASHGIGIYWTYEKFIRKCEARYRGVPGATGALYALRRELFSPIAESTLLDDVVIPMQAVVAGYRCLFESRAVAWDTPSTSPGQESIRKRRTIAGAVQLILHHPAWLVPWKNPIWLEFVSHKIARLFSPMLLLMAAVANATLFWHPAYRVLLAVHGCFYVSALAGWMFQRFGARSKCFGAQLMFLTLNATTVAALWDAVRGRFRATWKRVP